ncbi:MAG TPA: glycosyltransferase family 4 protein [Rhodocyclaceae bacterium]|nr:glycosyltransferase family 4 protein [Rhodocyclaceae bacterium]
MKLAYISPSILPSRSANSVHVMQQCDALGKLGVDVTLFAKRSDRTVDLRAELCRAYGVDLEGVTLSTVYTPWARANNITIALHALVQILGGGFDAVVSRNLFASFLLALVARLPLVVEVHQIERGFRGWLQRVACRGKTVRIVVISEQLGRDLVHRVGDGIAQVEVLHDAAPEMPALPAGEERDAWRSALLADPMDRQRFVCGYVGHLYPGRGIEIIEALARECPDVLFLAVGGNESDVAARRCQNTAPNLRFLGHVPHPVARRAMSAVDLLLMPYQAEVSIGLAGHDTGRWMSPMKMFEYMSSGTPFVASDLPVLREVLRDGDNAVLIAPDSILAWQSSILALRDDPVRRQTLARRAYDDYQANYTWRSRAERMITLVSK